MIGPFLKNNRGVNQALNLTKDNAHFLIWLLFAAGFFFVVTLIFQYRVLILDIKSKREELRLLEVQLQEQLKQFNEKIVSGQVSMEHLLHHEADHAHYLANTWIFDLEHLIADAKQGKAFLYFQNYYDAFLNETKSTMFLYNKAIEWRNQKNLNFKVHQHLLSRAQELLTRMRSTVDERQGTCRIVDALSQGRIGRQKEKGNRLADNFLCRNEDRGKYDVVLEDVLELKSLIEKFQYLNSLGDIKGLSVNSLDPVLIRLNFNIQSLEDEGLRNDLEWSFKVLGTLLFGSQPPWGSFPWQQMVGIEERTILKIKFNREGEDLSEEVASKFNHLKSLQLDLIRAVNVRIVDFQKEIDDRLESMWRDRLYLSIVGMLIWMLVTFLVSQTIRKQNAQLRKMAEELYDQRKKALESVEAKSNFMANMSHEIRTPMNAILGFTDLIYRTKLSPDQKKYLDIVKSSGSLLISIIDDILDISKLESGNIRLEKVEFNLESIIREVFKMVVLRMKNKPFDTYVQIADDIPLKVQGDPTRFKQILVNLLGNAVKFTSSGSIGVSVTKDDTIKVGQNEIALRFVVKDTGIGIPANKLEDVFKPFTQADESTTRKYGGTGLGLTICRALVEAMGGKIWVESQEGQGSSFIFNIKLMVQDYSGGKEQKSQESFPWLLGKTVFIVDDNQIAIKLLMKQCEVLGLKVFGIADSAQDAMVKLEKLFETRNIVPDIIFCDLIMQGMQGDELIRQLRKDSKFQNVCFVAVTADLKIEDSKDKSQAFDGYVTKPVFLEDLIFTLEHVFKPSVEGSSDNDGQKATEGARILVVEDTETNIILMQEYFDSFGWKGIFANSGREAIELLKKDQKFDLCLMDLQMPDIGGIEATRIIRQDISKELPIIALSAAVLEKDRMDALAAGMDGFLNKPIVVSQLKETVATYVLRSTKK